MSDIKFRAWDFEERKMYFRAYQKLTHVLLCEDDRGKNEGKGIPKKRAAFNDCELMQSTTLEDKNGKEIFEGDKIRIKIGGRTIEDIVEFIPDMFKSRKLHPLEQILEKNGIENTDDLEIEIIGNKFDK